MKFSAHYPVSFQESAATVATSILLYCRCVLQVFQYELCPFLCHCWSSIRFCQTQFVYEMTIFGFPEDLCLLGGSVSHLDGAEVL